MTKVFTLVIIVLLLSIQKSETLIEATQARSEIGHPVPETIYPVPKSYDLSTLFLTFHFPENWDQDPRFIEIWNWFETEAELQALKSAMKVHVYEEGTKFFNEKYAGHVTVPSILIQEPNGNIIFSATANNIPKTLHELISKINKKIPGKTQGSYANSYKCNDPNCPNCYPKKPMPRPTIIRPFVPEPEKEEELEEKPRSIVTLLLALLGGAGYGLYTKSEDKNV